MDVASLSDSKIRTAFTAAAEGDREAVVRCAAMLEGFDHLDDAAWMWRLGSQAGSPEAVEYCRAHMTSAGTRLVSGSEHDVLEAVLDRDRERASGDRPELVAWIGETMLKIRRTVIVCASHHMIEVDRPDDYKSCGECLHVWRTETDFVRDVEQDRERSRVATLQFEGLDLGPDTTPPQDQPFCPLCTHDF